MARAMAREAKRHRVERGLDDRRILWSLGSQEIPDLDSAAAFFETSALSAYNEAAVHRRMALKGTWAETGVVVARALAAFSDGVRASSPMKCTLFGLAVRESFRQRGIATILFRRMHAALYSACSRWALQSGKEHPRKLRATLELAPGHCRRQPIALLFYKREPPPRENHPRERTTLEREPPPRENHPLERTTPKKIGRASCRERV